MAGKIVIVSAPSGCGKSTIINALMAEHPELRLRFSVSATNRSPRPGEVDGREYRFLSTEEFRTRLAGGEFVEHEEVYPGRFYGTLRSEVDRITAEGDTCVLDIDVNGALRVKQMYGKQATAIFIAPPSLDALRDRLVGRGTETEAEIGSRLHRAAYEMGQAPRFDHVVVNDELAEAVERTACLIAAAPGGGEDEA